MLDDVRVLQARRGTRQTEVRHVAEPLGNCIYAFPNSTPRPKARESLLQRQSQSKEGRRAAAQLPEPQGLETDCS